MFVKVMDRVETMTTAVRPDNPRIDIAFRISAMNEGSSSDLLFSLQEWTALSLFLTREKTWNLHDSCYINIMHVKDINKFHSISVIL